MCVSICTHTYAGHAPLSVWRCPETPNYSLDAGSFLEPGAPSAVSNANTVQCVSALLRVGCSEEPHLAEHVLQCALCPWLQSEQPYLPSLSFSLRCRGAFCPSCVCLEVFEPGSHNVARIGFETQDTWLRCLFWFSQDPAVPSCPKAP